jgi:PLP dependent protein
MAGLSVGERLKNLKSRIAEACAVSGRSPESVHLLAVSKLQSPQLIRDASAAGQMDFAENYIQEANEKQASLVDLPARWHFIGRIQSNKLKYLVARFHIIHSVDRLEIALALNRLSEAQKLVQNIFLQVNMGREASKGGVDSAALEELLTEVVKCENLKVLGLMVMPPLFDHPADARPLFAAARGLLGEMQAKFGGRHPLNELSMGTSADFSEAIAEGATWVRIGSEVFGPREEKL